MPRIIRAKYDKGVITPLEGLDLVEGVEFSMAIMDIPSKPKKNAFEKSAGKWNDTINAKKLIKNIYSDRLIKTRKAVKL